MPRAIRGKVQILIAQFDVADKLGMKGVLVECDASIKSLIVKIDSEKHDYIVEELDDQTLVIQENMLPLLKAKLDEVSTAFDQA